MTKRRTGAEAPEYRRFTPPPPPAKASVKVPLETEEQQALFRWVGYQVGRYPELAMLYHISNEGRRNPRRAKAEGIKAGVPDLCLPVPRGPYHGLYIEMKRRKGGSLTPEQKGWLERLRGQGYAATRCDGWEQAAKLLLDYLHQE